MSTAFAALADMVVQQLLSAPALADGHVGLPKNRPVPSEWQRYIEVRRATADGRRHYVGVAAPITWTTNIAVDLCVRAAASGDADAMLDDLLSSTAQRLREIPGATLQALGVVSIDIDPRVEWAWVDGAEPRAVASYQFSVEHDTRGTTLAAP